MPTDVSNGGQDTYERGLVKLSMHSNVVSLGEIGARLRAERESRGLNQEDFGRIGAVTRNSQAAYEAGRRACDIEYLARLSANGVDVAFVVTGERSAATLAPEVADIAELSSRLGREERSALLVLAEAAAGRAKSGKQPQERAGAMPSVDSLEQDYREILAASRDMDEAGLARALAERLPTLLDQSRKP